MWIKSFNKIYRDAKKEDIWNAWADVNNYIKWHNDLDYCKLEGSFTVGNGFVA